MLLWYFRTWSRWSIYKHSQHITTRVNAKLENFQVFGCNLYFWSLHNYKLTTCYENWTINLVLKHKSVRNKGLLLRSDHYKLRQPEPLQLNIQSADCLGAGVVISRDCFLETTLELFYYNYFWLKVYVFFVCIILSNMPYAFVSRSPEVEHWLDLSSGRVIIVLTCKVCTV